MEDMDMVLDSDMPVLDMLDTAMLLPMLVLATVTVLDTMARDPLMPNPKLRLMLVFSMEDMDMVLDSDMPVLDMLDTAMLLPMLVEDMDTVLDSDIPVLDMLDTAMLLPMDTVLDTEVSTMVKKQYFKAHKSSNAICLQFSACFGRN